MFKKGPVHAGFDLMPGSPTRYFGVFFNIVN